MATSTPSKTRQIRDLTAEVVMWCDREEMWEVCARELSGRIETLEDRLTEAEEQARVERFYRACAQRGLVSYMRDHGLGDRIAYDPDEDPEVRALFARDPIADEICREVLRRGNNSGVRRETEPLVRDLMRLVPVLT